jgi:hypothetical protein
VRRSAGEEMAATFTEATTPTAEAQSFIDQAVQ